MELVGTSPLFHSSSVQDYTIHSYIRHIMGVCSVLLYIQHILRIFWYDLTIHPTIYLFIYIYPSNYLFIHLLIYLLVMGRLENTVIILCPVLPLLAMCVISIPLKWNYTRWFVYYYKARIGLG